MANTTKHVTLRIDFRIYEAAEREAIRLNRSKNWVMAAWMESGYLQLMPAGVTKDGQILPPNSTAIGDPIFVKRPPHDTKACSVYKCGMCAAVKA